MEPAAGAPADTRGLVLVCDDTESIRRLLRINLELDGFEVIESPEGEHVVAELDRLLASDRLPHVVILDAEMYPRDGWWALARIRSLPAYDGLPIIMATAEPACEDRARMRAAGLDACVRKPFDPDLVMSLVDGFRREGREHVPTL
ncbi:MAG TPA: response regulator [Dermatophilaceae bacterium]|nr:response regulator [Dermatophilaceae bacterium]